VHSSRKVSSRCVVKVEWHKGECSVCGGRVWCGVCGRKGVQAGGQCVKAGGRKSEVRHEGRKSQDAGAMGSRGQI